MVHRRIGRGGTWQVPSAWLHVADAARPAPPVGDTSTAGAEAVLDGGRHGVPTLPARRSADGTLTVKARAYGYRDHDSDGTFEYGRLAETYDSAADASYRLGQPRHQAHPSSPRSSTSQRWPKRGAGAETKIDGPKWVDRVVSTLTQERDLLSTLQSLNSDDTQTAEVSAWQRVQRSLQNEMLGNLPMKMDDAYGDLESEADAIDLINRALDALSSNANLAAALDPDGTGDLRPLR